MTRYGTVEQCEATLMQSRWPQGFICPESAAAIRRRSPPAIFAATKLPLTRWLLAMHLLTSVKNNILALDLMRLGVRYTTDWRIKHQLMAVTAVREGRRVLKARIDIDDTYLGGEHPGAPRGRATSLLGRGRVPLQLSRRSVRHARAPAPRCSSHRAVARAEAQAYRG